MKKPADFTLRVLENTINGMKLKIKNTEIQTSIIGNFNAYNLLAVFSIAKLLNLNEKNIYRSITLLKPPSGRFEIISSKNITAIVDYAHTPDALLNVMLLLFLFFVLASLVNILLSMVADVFKLLFFS